MLDLPALQWMKIGLIDAGSAQDSPLKGGSKRMPSPISGGSTLITSAPMSASKRVQYPPATARVKSSTLTPRSTPSFGLLIAPSPPAC